MDNILGLLAQRDSIPDILKQQLLFIVSLLVVYFVQVSAYVALSIIYFVLDCLCVVYTHIKPDVYSTLVATLPSTREDLFFMILYTLDITATTLWSWPQLPPQQEPASIMSAVRLAYNTVRGHSISPDDARKLYLWLPETMSTRLIARECYHRSLSHVSGIPMFKLPFVVNVLLSKRSPGQNLDYVLARLPNAVTTLVHDEICEEMYTRHATALATIVVFLGFIFFSFFLFKLSGHIFSVITNGFVSLWHYVLFPIRFLVNHSHRVRRIPRIFRNPETQTAEAQPEVVTVQPVLTDGMTSIHKEDKSPEQRRSDNTSLTDSIRDESCAEGVVLTNGNSAAQSEESGCIGEPAVKDDNESKDTLKTVEEPRSTPLDLQRIQVYTGTPPSRPPKSATKPPKSSSLLEHGPMSVPWMSSQWNTSARQNNNLHAINFNMTSPHLGKPIKDLPKPGATMLGHRNQRPTATPDSFFLAGAGTSSLTRQSPGISQYFNAYTTPSTQHAYTTQFPPNGLYAEPPSRHIIYNSRISLEEKRIRELSEASNCKDDGCGTKGSNTIAAPTQLPSGGGESGDCGPNGRGQPAVRDVCLLSVNSSNTAADKVTLPVVTESSQETGLASGVTDSLVEDEIFVYPDGTNANTQNSTLQAVPELAEPASAQNEITKKVDNPALLPVNDVQDKSTNGPSAPARSIAGIKDAEFTFNVEGFSRASSVPADGDPPSNIFHPMVRSHSIGGVRASMHAPTRTMQEKTPEQNELASSQPTGLAASIHASKSDAREVSMHASEPTKLVTPNPSHEREASIHASVKSSAVDSSESALDISADIPKSFNNRSMHAGPSSDHDSTGLQASMHASKLESDSSKPEGLAASMHASNTDEPSIEELFHQFKEVSKSKAKNKKKKRH